MVVIHDFVEFEAQLGDTQIFVFNVQVDILLCWLALRWSCEVPHFVKVRAIKALFYSWTQVWVKLKHLCH